MYNNIILNIIEKYQTFYASDLPEKNRTYVYVQRFLRINNSTSELVYTPLEAHSRQLDNYGSRGW